MTKLFISYHRGDRDEVKALADDLSALGHGVWFDQELCGGQTWWEEILASVRGSDIFIFALTPRSLQSTACLREFDYASALHKPVLPLLLTTGISTSLLPQALSVIEHVDYRGRDREAALRLSRAITNAPCGAALPDPLPPMPQVPVSYLLPLAERVDGDTPLSLEEQSAILVELKAALLDPDHANDAREILDRFKDRRDLFQKIAVQIDELCAKAPAPNVGPASPSNPGIDGAAHPSDDPQPPRPPLGRRAGALLGGIIGSLYGGVPALLVYSSEGASGSIPKLFEVALAYAAIGAAAFAVVGGLIIMNWRAWLTISIVMATVICVWIGKWGTYRDVVLMAVGLGGAGAALLTSLIWAAVASVLRGRAVSTRGGFKG